MLMKYKHYASICDVLHQNVRYHALWISWRGVKFASNLKCK